MTTLKFGWAEVSITPDKKVSLEGQFAERISQYVEKNITATALAIEGAGEQAVMVTCDLSGISTNLMEAIRDKLSGNGLGLDPINVIVSAIHTHTGPVYPKKDGSYKYDKTDWGLRHMVEAILPAGKRYVENLPVAADPDVITPEETFDFLVDRICTVILQAWDNRKPGGYVNAFGRAAVGMCRRVTYSDGTAKMWGDTNTAVFDALEGGNDSGIELLYVFNEGRELTGIIANLACPAQCVQHRHFISPDFWGEVKMLLRKHFGEHIYLLTQCSAAGDQCPVDLVRWVQPESDLNDPNCERTDPPARKADPSMFDLAGMRKVGRRIAQEIINVYEDGLDPVIWDTQMKHWVKILELPLRRVSLTEVEQAHKAIQAYLNEKSGDVDFMDGAAMYTHLGILQRQELQEKMDVLDTEVHILRLGNVVFATNPFELFLNYGNQIKARSLAEQTFLVQLANGYDGYLPTKKAEEGGHYSAYVTGGLIGHQGGELLVRQTVQSINNAFRK